MSPRPETFERFVRAAEQACDLLEGRRPVSDRTTFVWAIRSALAEVLAAGYCLPEVEPSLDEPPDWRAAEAWKAVFGHVQVSVGDLPGGPESSLLVADALADTWRDLRTGLDALASGTRWADVSWEWRLGLQTHWGKHAEEALVALHDA